MSQLPLWENPLPGRRASIRPLSKSRVVAGLQCLKRLYLECYAPRSLRDPLDEGKRALFDAGKQVGEVARGRYPGGVRIVDDPQLHDQAARDTAAALADSRVPAIYEAAFTFDDIRVRVDVLARTEDRSWDLIEVKSSTRYKGGYLGDIAVQAHVVAKSGVPLRRACLLHMNSRYVWNGGPYDLDALFALLDVSDSAHAVTPTILERVDGMREALRSTEPPVIPVGPHCERPYRCPFYGHCHDGGPKHRVSELPRLTPKVYRLLEDRGIETIEDIPEDFEPLSDLQRRVRDSVVRGRPFRDPILRSALGAVRFPAHFLDFETCNPALPIIPGTRPFQQMPFQWSDHVLESDGTLRHRGYLHTDRTDPRPALSQALVEALDGGGSIVVYSNFESRVIAALAREVPALAGPLEALLGERIVDLHQLIHDHYYHPEFHGSFSIKDVAPVLLDGQGYGDLMIQEGSQAASAFGVMTDPSTAAGAREAIRRGLLAYCERDTESMVRLYQKLREVS
jgi:hypothetical protein